jgi:hypothetical protein
MAEGRSVAAIAARMFVTEKSREQALHQHLQLGLQQAAEDNRRVLAVPAYLQG